MLKSPIEQRHEMANSDLVQLLTDWQTETYPLQALLPSGRFVPRRVKSFVDFLAAKFGELASALEASR